MKVCILGAGPCGLTAAWELAKKSVDVTVVEKDKAVGGLCKTERRDGYQFDLGGHRFISKDSQLVEDVRALMGSELLTRKRKSVIRFRHRQYDYPLDFRNLISGSSPWMNVKFAAGYLASVSGLIPPGGRKDSFHHWAESRFGKVLSDFFFRPYTEKLWGIDAGNLSSDWAAQRIPQLDLKSVLLGALGLNRQKIRTFAPLYLYPRRGIGAIFESMSEEVKRQGGEIVTGASVVGIKSKGGKIQGVVLDADGGSRFIEADVFLSTIPLDELQKLLGEGDVSLPYRSLRFLNVMLDRESLSPNTWMYVPERDLVMTRIQEPRRRSEFSAPEGKTSVMLEIPCEYGDKLWNMPDEELLERTLRDMKKLGFDISAQVRGCFSTRARHAYPRFEIGYREKVNHIRKRLKTYQNLSTLGRQGLFRYIFMDTAMLMGRRWANSLMQNGRDAGIEEMENEPVLLETASVAHCVGGN